MSMDAGDALTQSMKIALDGTEHTIQIVGKTTEQISKTIAFIMALLQKNQDKPSIGKTNLVKMLQSGQPLKAITLKQDDLPRFADLAKQYGVPFTPIKDMDKNTNQLDVLVHENDAESINRVFEKLNQEKISDEPEEAKKKSMPESQKQKDKMPENKTVVSSKLKEEKPSVIVKINQAKKELQKQAKNKGKSQSKSKSATERS